MSLTLTQNLGHSVSEAVLRKALEGVAMVGYAAVKTAGEADVSLDHFFEPQDIAYENIRQFCDLCKNEHHLTLYFDKQKDTQPFILQSVDGKVVLVAFVEGDFSLHHDANGKSDACNFVDEVLKPQVEQMWDAYSGDMDKVVKWLLSQNFLKTIKSQYGARGVLTFMTNTGASFVIETNELRGNPDDTCSLSDNSLYSASAVVEPEKKLTGIELLKQKAAGGSPSPAATSSSGKSSTKEAALQEDIKNADALPPDPMSEYEVREVKDVKYVFPTAFVCGDQNRLKGWCMSTAGTIPQGYHLAVNHPEKFPACFPLDKIKADSKVGKRILKSFGDLGKLATTTNGQGKDTQPKSVTPDMARPTATVSAFPIIARTGKEWADKFIKNVDLKSNEIVNPDTLEPINNDKKPDFYAQFPDWTRETICLVSSAKILELCQKRPDIAQLLIDTLRYDYAAMMSKFGAKGQPASTPAAEGNALKEYLAKRKAG